MAFLNLLRIRPCLPSVAFFLLAALLVHFAVETERSRQAQLLQQRVAQDALALVARLETELNANVYLANGLVAYINAVGTPSAEGMNRALKALFQSGRHLRNLGAAPGNRLSYIYPLKGNEAVLGMYYPESPGQWPAVRRAIAERSTVLAGPVQLLQGGMGLVSRTPVYFEDGRYWGILSLVLDLDSLIQASKLWREVDGVRFALRGKDGQGSAGEVFFGDEALFAQDALLLPVRIPGGEWQMAALPVGGWKAGQGQLWLMEGLGLVGCLVAAAMLFIYLQGRRRILASERRLRAFLDTTRDGVIVIDERGLILEFNRAAECLFGYGAEDILGTSLNQLMPADQAAVHDRHLRNAGGMAAGRPREVTGRRKDGTEFPMELTVGEARIVDTRVFVGVVRDITERRAFEQQLLEAATRDSLTGVLNRRAFAEALEEAVALARRHGRELSLLLIDADHFKKINDNYGHHVGDAALVSLAKVAEESLRGTDLFGRWGGEEFVALLPETDGQQAVEVAERLLAAVRQVRVNTDEGEELRLTVSIGMAALSGDAPGVEKLIQQADRALYQAKAQGRDCWRA